MLKEQMVRRIGILSGTFDPVHIGHIQAALACREALGLEVVLLTPFGRPLIREPEAAPQHRWHMLELAVSGRPGLELCDADLQKAPRYAVDTVRSVQRLFPDARLTYIVGADKPSDIPTWREAANLFGLCDFAVYPRAGFDAAALTDFLNGHGAQAVLISAPLLSMSSGQIRAQLRLLSDAPGMLLPEIAEYIAANGLYQPDYTRMVRQAVSGSRFTHILGVREAGVRLARIHGVPMQKMGVAAILHDCAKNMEISRLQAIAQNARLTRDPIVLSSNALLHGLVGAHIAKMRYHINDTHILNAIRYHTTGRSGMDKLELALFVADAIEPSRKYPGLEQVREQAELDLRLAALTSLTGTQDFVKTKGGVNSPLSAQAIHDLRHRLARDEE
jgi:nicotinate-nucleotide adenylyltransferase